MKKLIFFAIVLVFSFFAAPAMADMFGFSFSNLRSTFDGSNTFQSMDWSSTTGDLYRNIAPTGTASFDSGSWNLGGTSEDLLIQMTIGNITASTADGSGSFTIKDIDGDTLTGSVSGTWQKMGVFPVFTGTLYNVTYTSDDTTFDGHSGDSVSMVFNVPQPWNGALLQLSPKGAWFASGTSFDVKGGSIDAEVLPVPPGVLLGILGFCVAGLKLRKFA